MIEIVNSYKQQVPALKFIGKKYGDKDRVEGGFGECWHTFFEKGYFQAIEDVIDAEESKQLNELYMDSNNCLGFMRYKEGEPFQYWIGRFAPLATATPDGFQDIKLPAAELGVCWVKGIPPEIYGKEMLCAQHLEQQGMKVKRDEHGAFWFFERYSGTRFNDKDEAGNVIVDICHYV